MFASTPSRQNGDTKISSIVPGTGTERRRDKRYQVDLPGTLCSGGTTCAVTVSDLSASGALVSIPAELAGVAVPDVVLVVDAFGPIDARIVHVGDSFYGLRFLQPHLLRDRLGRWLQQDVGSP
ncbi:MAG: PilZ domain-containing protein [Janthinobacterium lividum]